MKTWNIGIIGAGMVADFHARSIQHLPNTKLTGICDGGSGKAAALAEKYNCTAFADYKTMLKSKDIDIVTIASPSGMHKEPAVEAALHGKHVLCEKPLDITLDRIDAMIAAHKKAGTQLGGIFNYRFTDAVHTIKQAIDNGRFGIMTHVAVEVPWWRSDEYYKSKWRGTWALDGGGALMNQSIHMVDMLQYFAGPLESLHGYVATLGHTIQTEDTATAIVRFKNKALGSIYGSTASFPGQPRKITVTGTLGTVIMQDNQIKVWQFANELAEDKTVISKYAVDSGGAASAPSAIPFEMHANNIAAFITALDQGRPFEIDGAEARKAVEIVLAIYRSAKENREYVF
ncbi:MAG: Gfo/Idh/MocA family oxidoreductase [Agriterribacter sp.]